MGGAWLALMRRRGLPSAGGTDGTWLAPRRRRGPPSAGKRGASLAPGAPAEPFAGGSDGASLAPRRRRGLPSEDWLSLNPGRVSFARL